MVNTQIKSSFFPIRIKLTLAEQRGGGRERDTQRRMDDGEEPGIDLYVQNCFLVPWWFPGLSIVRATIN